MKDQPEKLSFMLFYAHHNDRAEVFTILSF